MSWDAAFTELPPIKLPDGRMLRTLADCHSYLLALPEHEQAEPRWQAAAKALLQAAEHGGPFTPIARFTFSRAVYGLDDAVPPSPPHPTKRDRWKARRKKPG
jgi:hypothetical protein